MDTATPVRRSLLDLAREMRDVAQRDRVGRAALFAVWFGLGLLSCGTTTLQLTPTMTRRPEWT